MPTPHSVVVTVEIGCVVCCTSIAAQEPESYLAYRCLAAATAVAVVVAVAAVAAAAAATAAAAAAAAASCRSASAIRRGASTWW